MPKARKRKNPITNSSHTSTSSSKPESTRSVIRKFHVLIKQQAQLQKTAANDLAKKSELDHVEREIDELGGLQSYQNMSVSGQGKDRGGGSEKVLIKWLKERDVHKRDNKLRLLEVGALKHDNYQSCSTWIDNTPMDLNSRHSKIIQQDFLRLDEEDNRKKWDTISLSLVLNFVPEPSNRGRMLRLAHSFLVEGGYLFVALPLPCLANSRYVDFEVFTSLMNFLGFTELSQHSRKGGKMIYYLFQRNTDDTSKNSGISVPEQFSKKKVLRQGNRNNFSILL